jgi:hypothetical protein
MAQRRMLSRRISQSEKVNKLSKNGQIVWTWTIPWLDDYGCYTGGPEDIKSEVFPRNPKISTKDIKEALLEEANISLILLYKTGGRTYQQYQNFENNGNGDTFQTFKSDRERVSSYPQYQQGFELIGNTGNPVDSNAPLSISKVKLSKSEVEVNSDNNEIGEFTEKLIKHWNKIIARKCESLPDQLAVEREIAAIKIPMPIEELLTAVDYYAEALALPDSQACKVWTLYQWLQRGHYNKFLPGQFNIENYRGSNFNKGEQGKDNKPPPPKVGQDGLTAQERYHKQQETLNAKQKRERAEAAEHFGGPDASAVA